MANDSPDWKGQTDVAPVYLGDLLLPVNVIAASAVFTLPGAATGLVILAHQQGTTGTFSVSGGVSGARYGSATADLTNGDLFSFPALGDWDNPVTVACSLNAVLPGPGPTTLASVFAVLGSGFTQVDASVAQPLPVSATGSVVTTSVPSGGAPPTPLPFSNSIAANGSASLVVGVVGKRLTVYGFDIMISPASGGGAGAYAVSLQDDGTNAIFGRGQLHVETLVGASVAKLGPLWIPGGYVLQPSSGVKAVAPVSNAGNIVVAGVLWATQQ